MKIAKSFNNYNKNISDYKLKENTFDERQVGSQIRLEDVLFVYLQIKRQNQINQELKQSKYYQQQIYKKTLDNQQIEKLFYSPQGKRIKDNYITGPKDQIVIRCLNKEHSFFDKNVPVSVAPCKDYFKQIL